MNEQRNTEVLLMIPRTDRHEDNSRLYRTFVHLIARFGWILPKRLRCHSMVFIFESEAEL